METMERNVLHEVVNTIKSEKDIDILLIYQDPSNDEGFHGIKGDKNNLIASIVYAMKESEAIKNTIFVACNIFNEQREYETKNGRTDN